MPDFEDLFHVYCQTGNTIAVEIMLTEGKLATIVHFF